MAATGVKRGSRHCNAVGGTSVRRATSRLAPCRDGHRAIGEDELAFRLLRVEEDRFARLLWSEPSVGSVSWAAAARLVLTTLILRLILILSWLTGRDAAPGSRTQSKLATVGRSWA